MAMHTQPATTDSKKDEGWTGERRQVSILFADIASFTATSEHADPEDVIDMLNLLFTRLMAECDAEGGYLDKTVGDEMMVLFGAPKAHEDDPARATRAAMGMQKAMREMAPMMKEKVGKALHLNIGINSGPVVWGEVGPQGRTRPTVIGDTVNVAARLESYATSGRIIVSETVYQRTQDLFEYQVLEPIRVKGKSAFIPIYSPLRPKEKTKKSKSTVERISTPFTGREKELESLHAYWARSSSGRSQVVLIQGEAGAGKTRLMEEFLSTVDSRTMGKTPITLHVKADDATLSGNAYHPLASLLYQLFVIEPGDTELVRRRKVEDRARILGITSKKFLPLISYLVGWYQQDPRLEDQDPNLKNQLAQLRVAAIDATVDLFFKQSTRRPMIIVADDLHLAESSMVEALNRLTMVSQMTQHDGADYKLMIVAATRPQPGTPVDRLQVDNMIVLKPLNETNRREMINNLFPGSGLPETLIERLSKESGGNPFYLIEVANALLQSEQLVKSPTGRWSLTRPIDQISVPHSVEGLVLAKLDMLSPPARTVLQHAAVIGQTFSMQLLYKITPGINLNHALGELVNQHLVKEVQRTSEGDIILTFNQMVVREVTFSTILRRRRRELQDQIAQYTDLDSSAPIEDLETLTFNFASVGNREKMIAYNLLTGSQGLERGEYSEAVHHLQLAWAAIREMPNPNPEIYYHIASLLGDATAFQGDYMQSATCYKVAYSLSGANRRKQSDLHYKLGRLNFFQANLNSASESYLQAMNLNEDDPDMTAQIEAEYRLLFDLS